MPDPLATELHQQLHHARNRAIGLRILAAHSSGDLRDYLMKGAREHEHRAERIRVYLCRRTNAQRPARRTQAPGGLLHPLHYWLSQQGATNDQQSQP